MTTNKTIKHDLQTILEGVSDEASDVQLRSYSGRGMYGAECLAVTGATVGELMAAIIMQLVCFKGDHYEVAQAIEGLKTDSLGCDIVIYFPGVEYLPEETEENETEE